jgi:hypothetical protein
VGANDIAYLGAVAIPSPTPLYGHVYRVTVSNLVAMGITNRNDITSSNDTRGIAVYANRVYAAQDNSGLPDGRDSTDNLTAHISSYIKAEPHGALPFFIYQ